MACCPPPLREATVDNAATLCRIAIQTIWDLHTQASFIIDAVEEMKDNDSNEENVATDSAQ
jgi:hypothetical protein